MAFAPTQQKKTRAQVPCEIRKGARHDFPRKKSNRQKKFQKSHRAHTVISTTTITTTIATTEKKHRKRGKQGDQRRAKLPAHTTRRDRNATETAPNNEPATRSSPLQHQSRPPFLIMRLLTQRRAHWIDLKTKRVDKQSTDNVFD